jgi:ring-1,2-phenylacetyl-CoA epoxidase subunit PaaE
MSDFHSLKVSEIRKDTANAVVVTFEVPVDSRSEFNFTAGQYITIKHMVDGKEVRRAYSICTAPSNTSFSVGIKKVVDGSFSVFANDSLKEGDVLEVMLPQGKFILQPDAKNTHNYAAFAAGSGITPVLSIITAALNEEPQSTFLLVYGNQTKEDAMFYDELSKLKQDFSGRFFLENIYSRSREDGARFGRIDRGIVNYYIKNQFKDTIFDAFYLCGPEPMIDAVSSTLKENGTNEKIIHFELFTSSEEGLLVNNHEGNTTVTILLDDEEKTFVMPQNKSILEAALENDLDAPYSCQGGICSTCIARITKGKAEMGKNQILTDSEIADGFILTCQAHPTTAEVFVDYDDV